MVTKQDSRKALMDNGATVSDWLGTAAVAAGLAQMYATDVRNGIAGAGKLIEARALAAQALYELDAVIARLGELDA